MHILAAKSEVASNRLRYAIAHGTRSIAWSAVDLLLAWHLHVVVGLSGIEASWLLFVFLITGSLASLAVGYWLSKSRAAAEGYVRFQLIGGVAAAALLALQFLTRDAVIVIAAGLGFRIAFAMQEVTQNALASLLPSDDADTKIYARLHVMLSSAARLLVLVAHVLLLRFQDIVSRSAIIVGMAFLTMIGALGLRRVRFPATRPSPSTFSWRAFPRIGWLLLAFAASTVMMPTLTRLLIFLPGRSGQANFASWMVGAYYVGSMTGPPILARLAMRNHDRRAAPSCVAIAAISATIVLLPLPTPMRAAAAMLHGIALSMLVVGLWADAALAARSDGSDGLVFGSVTFTMHISSAFGALLMGPLIEGIEKGGWTATIATILLTTIGAGSIAILRPMQRVAPASA